jgi:hypothetical protein
MPRIRWVALGLVPLLALLFALASCLGGGTDNPRADGRTDDDAGDDDNDDAGDDDDNDTDDDDNDTDDDDDDILPPLPDVTFHITDPASGTYFTGYVINVTGIVAVSGGTIGYLKVNGHDATIDGTTFTATGLYLDPENKPFQEIVAQLKVIDGANEYRFEDRAILLNGEYNDLNAYLADAVHARINESAINQIVVAINNELNQIDLYQLLQEQNPIFHEQYDDPLFGFPIVEVTVNVTSADYDQINLAMDPTVWNIDVDGAVTNVNVGLDAAIDWFKDATGMRATTGSVHADSITVHARLFITVVGDGEIHSELTEFNVAINGFSWGIDGFPDFFTDLFTDTIRNALQSQIEAQLKQIIEQYMTEFLGALDLSVDIPPFSVDLPPAYFEPAEDGIWMYMNGRFMTTEVDPEAPSMIGTYATPQSVRIQLPATIPGSGAPYGVGLAVSDDFLNQALAAVVRSGMLNLTLDGTIDIGGEPLELTAGTLALFIPGFSVLGADTPVTLRLVPTLPPIAQPGEAGGAVAIDMMDYRLTFSVDWQGVPTDVLSVGMDATFTGVPSVSEDGRFLTISLSEPTVDMRMRMTRIEADENDIEEMVGMLFQLALPLIGDSLGNIPMPVFEGFVLTPIEFGWVGPDADYLGIFADFAPAEAVAGF